VRYFLHVYVPIFLVLLTRLNTFIYVIFFTYLSLSFTFPSFLELCYISDCFIAFFGGGLFLEGGCRTMTDPMISLGDFYSYRGDEFLLYLMFGLITTRVGWTCYPPVCVCLRTTLLPLRYLCSVCCSLPVDLYFTLFSCVLVVFQLCVFLPSTTPLLLRSGLLILVYRYVFSTFPLSCACSYICEQCINYLSLGFVTVLFPYTVSFPSVHYALHQLLCVHRTVQVSSYVNTSC